MLILPRNFLVSGNAPHLPGIESQALPETIYYMIIDQDFIS